ncbi:MAG: hypothetical protein ABSF47_00120 [Minisyncoccia bacterium]|jgi:hypothetical protein
MNIPSLLLLIQSVLSLLTNIQSAPVAQQQAALQLANQVLVVVKEELSSLTVVVPTATTTATTTQAQIPMQYSPSTQYNTNLPIYGPALQL